MFVHQQNEELHLAGNSTSFSELAALLLESSSRSMPAEMPLEQYRVNAPGGTKAARNKRSWPPSRLRILIQPGPLRVEGQHSPELRILGDPERLLTWADGLDRLGCEGRSGDCLSAMEIANCFEPPINLWFGIPICYSVRVDSETDWFVPRSFPSTGRGSEFYSNPLMLAPCHWPKLQLPPIYPGPLLSEVLNLSAPWIASDRNYPSGFRYTLRDRSRCESEQRETELIWKLLEQEYLAIDVGIMAPLDLSLTWAPIKHSSVRQTVSDTYQSWASPTGRMAIDILSHFISGFGGDAAYYRNIAPLFPEHADPLRHVGPQLWWDDKLFAFTEDRIGFCRLTRTW